LRRRFERDAARNHDGELLGGLSRDGEGTLTFNSPDKHFGGVTYGGYALPRLFWVAAHIAERDRASVRGARSGRR